MHSDFYTQYLEEEPLGTVVVEKAELPEDANPAWDKIELVATSLILRADEGAGHREGVGAAAGFVRRIPAGLVHGE